MIVDNDDFCTEENLHSENETEEECCNGTKELVKMFFEKTVICLEKPDCMFFSVNAVLNNNVTVVTVLEV